MKADVLVVISHMGAGGTQKVVRELIENISLKNKKIVLLVNEKRDLSVFNNNKNIVIEYGVAPKSSGFLKLNTFFALVISICKTRAVINKYSPDVTLGFICPTNIRLIISSFFLNHTKVIISERNNPARQVFSWPIRTLRKLLYKYADIVTYNSPGAQSYLEKFIPSNKLAYTPNSIEVKNDGKQFVPNFESLNLLYVGRLVAQKRVLETLQIFHRLVSMRSVGCFTLTYVGDGEQRELLQDYIDRNELSNCVKLVGHIDDVEKYYISANVFVLLSEYEGMPNSLLEAMSYGLCCIISEEVNESANIIVDNVNGIVLKKGNINNKAMMIDKLFDDKEFMKSISQKTLDSLADHKKENVNKIWQNILGY